MKNLPKAVLHLLASGAFVLLCAILSSCVPTPSENTNVAPKITDLHSFFIPQQTGKEYLWHHIPQTPQKDSAYFLAYTGQKNSPSSEGYSPVSMLQFSDTLSGDSVVHESYVSDSLIVYYFGKSDDPLTPRQIFLRDTLQVGASWSASDNFITSNGTPVSIRAVVEAYYPEISSAGNSYQDVFSVSYTAKVKGSQIPAEPEYQGGAHISRYYARGIGDILERCLDARDTLIWTNELTETRIR